MGRGILDLEKQFAQYGSYHSNSTNVLIHTLFVWPIFFSALILLHFLPFYPHLNLAFFFALAYGVFYVALDPIAGSLAALLCAACFVGSGAIAGGMTFDFAWKVVLAAQLLCWTGQFIGHGVFEKRAPALLDNLSQAFLMAPFFVLLEVLQKLFGYEPYPGFNANVHAKIDANIKEWKVNKQKKST